MPEVGHVCLRTMLGQEAVDDKDEADDIAEFVLSLTNPIWAFQQTLLQCGQVVIDKPINISVCGQVVTQWQDCVRRGNREAARQPLWAARLTAELMHVRMPKRPAY